MSARRPMSPETARIVAQPRVVRWFWRFVCAVRGHAGGLPDYPEYCARCGRLTPDAGARR